MEGTKKRKWGSTKAKKARKNVRIPEEKLVWGFHPEGGASQFANLTKLTEFSSLRELPRSWRRVPCGKKHAVPGLLWVQEEENRVPIRDQTRPECPQERSR
jgi:hypothetical protein